MRWSYLVGLIGAFACTSARGDTWSGEVVRVHDGDTITVVRDKTRVRVRLRGVDAPEKGQPFGRDARQLTSKLVLGKQVRVEEPEPGAGQGGPGVVVPGVCPQGEGAGQRGGAGQEGQARLVGQERGDPHPAVGVAQRQTIVEPVQGEVIVVEGLEERLQASVTAAGLRRRPALPHPAGRVPPLGLRGPPGRQPRPRQAS